MRNVLRAIAWVSFTAACAGPPPPAPPSIEPPPAPAPTVSVAPAPTVAPATPPKDEPAPAEILAKLTADQRRELDELGALCPTAVFREGAALAVGCTCCPSRCQPPPDRQPRMAPPDATRVSPYARLRGSFTEKGADERLVVMDSCSCAGCFDDAFVLRADAAGALAVRVHAGIRAQGGCRLVHRRGQVDRALCASNAARMGYAAATLELYDLTRAAPEPGAELAATFSFVALDDLILRCAPDVPFAQRSLTRWELRDDELAVTLSVSDGVVTLPMLQRECGEDSNPTKPREVELRWKASPQGFSPTAKTAAELRRLDAWEKREHKPR